MQLLRHVGPEECQESPRYAKIHVHSLIHTSHCFWHPQISYKPIWKQVCRSLSREDSPCSRILVHQQLLQWKTLQNNNSPSSPLLRSFYCKNMQTDYERAADFRGWLSEDILNISHGNGLPPMRLFTTFLAEAQKFMGTCCSIFLPFPSHLQELAHYCRPTDLGNSHNYSSAPRYVTLCGQYSCSPHVMMRETLLHLNSLPFHRLTWQK